ncbi:hypothetical protein ACFC4G_39075 [Streptomyces sp. NPDC056002]|uniref:hypothetical protein n=1 Tax=Streptomyces sp. NPDC056002 TaxID=3345675 RepID=UPI0035E01036
MSTAIVIEVPSASDPPGTPVAVYACLASPVFGDSTLRGVKDFVRRHGWVSVEAFIDIAGFASSADERVERVTALALVASKARSVVAPGYSMLWHGPEGHTELADWQERTGAWVSSPWNTAEVAAKLGALRPMRAAS